MIQCIWWDVKPYSNFTSLPKIQLGAGKLREFLGWFLGGFAAEIEFGAI